MFATVSTLVLLQHMVIVCEAQNVLASVLAQHMVPACAAQKTVDDSICELCIDQLYQCRANLSAITANAKDVLRRKDDCRKDVLFEGK